MSVHTMGTGPVLVTNQDLDPSALRRAFGVFPTGVVAVAAEVDGVLVGLAASSFTSVSLDPPLVSVAVANASQTWPALRRAARIGISILAEEHQALCRQLAGPPERRFDGVAATVTEQGAVTLDDGLARFDCSIHSEVPAGDHLLVLLQLQEVRHRGGAPLVFHRSGFGRLTS